MCISEQKERTSDRKSVGPELHRYTRPLHHIPGTDRQKTMDTYVPKWLAERAIPDADKRTIWNAQGSSSFWSRYTVHLNDDGTTSLYYTADLES